MLPSQPVESACTQKNLSRLSDSVYFASCQTNKRHLIIQTATENVVVLLVVVAGDCDTVISMLFELNDVKICRRDKY